MMRVRSATRSSRWSTSRRISRAGPSSCAKGARLAGISIFGFCDRWMLRSAIRRFQWVIAHLGVGVGLGGIDLEE